MYIYNGGDYSGERRIIGDSIDGITRSIRDISDRLKMLDEMKLILTVLRIAVTECDDSGICVPESEDLDDRIEEIDSVTEKLSEEKFNLRGELKEALWLAGTRTCTTSYPTTSTE